MTCTKSRPCLERLLVARIHPARMSAGCGIDPVKRCVKRADAAARQDLLDGGKAMAVADPVEDRVEARNGDGQRHMPGLGRGHEAARLGLEDGAGVEPGAEAHHQLGGMGEWAGCGSTSIRFSGAIWPIAWPCACKSFRTEDFSAVSTLASTPRSMRQSRLVSCTTPSRTGPAPATQTPPIWASVMPAGLRDRRRSPRRARHARRCGSDRRWRHRPPVHGPAPRACSCRRYRQPATVCPGGAVMAGFPVRLRGRVVDHHRASA
jgi:hypothetical protein